MKRRVKRLKGLQQLQKQLYDLSVWRLNSTEGRLSSLENARSELIDVKGNHPMYCGPLGVLAGSRLRSVERDIASARENQRALAQHVLSQGGRLKMVERLSKAADADYRSRADRLELAEIIEKALRDGSSS